MKKTVKTALALTGAGALAVAGLSEFLYESMLNVRFANKMVARFPIEDLKMMKVLLTTPLYVDGYAWYDELKLPDVTATSRDGKTVHGYILKNPQDTGKWLICAHGYRGDARAEAPYARHLYENGFSVVFVQMRAHEHDENRYCSMGYYDKDIILAWIDFLTRMDPDCRILLHGVSMGAATVMLATGEKLPGNVRCAVADCGYTSCWDIYCNQIRKIAKIPPEPILAAVNAVSRIRGNFDFKKCSPIKAVARSSTPTLFIQGTDDDMVPYTMSDELVAACTADKEQLVIPDAVHAGSAAKAPDLYFRTMDAFIAKYMEEQKA